MARLPVYKKIQGKGWEEVREEPMDVQAQSTAIMNDWMGRKYRILQAEVDPQAQLAILNEWMESRYRYLEADKLQQQKRDTNAEVNIPDPGVQAEKEARNDGDQIIKEIMESILQDEAEELQKKKRDTDAEVNIP